MKKTLIALAAAALLSFNALAGPPPRYFVDESKLPFAAVPSVPTQRLWGVHNNAGYRIEVPPTGTASSCCGPTATAAPGWS